MATDDNTRFCPLHGDYPIADQETACPECRADPEQSTISLQRVRVVGTGDFSTLATGDSHLTPIDNEVPCPVCGQEVLLAEFRHEGIGEVWTREAAEWAEEGVCPPCYRDILPPYIREWSDGEWLSHHYEGWRNTVESVTEIRKYGDSAQETWLPPDERHRLLDVERTLSARREHLALCQSAMEDLLARYPSSITPPPFDQMLLDAREQSVSLGAISGLKSMREADVAVEDERREVSVRFDVTDIFEPEGVAQLATGESPTSEEEEPPAGGDDPPARGGQRRWPALIAAAVVLVVLLWLLSRA